MTAETWREIPGFPHYDVSDLGDVRSRKRRTRPVSLQTNRRYVAASIRRPDGSRAKPNVHRLVLEAFVGPCPAGMVACHCNGNSHDNRLQNLRWDSHKANIADKNIHGTMARGSRHGAHTRPETVRRGSSNGRTALTGLNEAKVALLRWLRKEHSTSFADLAEWFGLRKSNVQNVIQRRTWRHVT